MAFRLTGAVTVLLAFLAGCTQSQSAPLPANVHQGGTMSQFTRPADDVLRQKLTPIQYDVTRKDGTEPASPHAKTTPAAVHP